MNDVVDSTRRALLRGSAAMLTTLAAGVTLIAEPAAAAGEKRKRWGLLIDAAKCTEDCTACVTACRSENGWGEEGHPATDPQWLRKLTVTDRQNGTTISLPMLCQHCARPPCVDVCPTGASFKRGDGIVLVDKHICIGCRYCMMACPYKARSFVHAPLEGQKPHAPRGKGTVESCTLCVHRIDRGGIPACVEACNATGRGAMLFGDLNDPASEIARRVAAYPTTRVRADLGTEPGVLYRNI